MGQKPPPCDRRVQTRGSMIRSRGDSSRTYDAAMTSKHTSRREAQPRVASKEDVVAGRLPQAMPGGASPAKAALGDKPVFAYIASLPQPQRGIAEKVDALAAETLPDL